MSEANVYVKLSTEWLGDKSQPVPAGYAEQAYARLLHLAEGDDWQRDGLAETPERAARAWAELTSGYSVDVPALFKTFESDADELVVVEGIPFYSLCEHHLLPFHGHAHIGYIPRGKVLGLSKFARVVRAYAARLQIQEGLTEQIAAAIDHHLSPKGVIVVMGAEHLCMSMRGVRAPGSITYTSAIRGVFQTNPSARAEALALIHPHRRTP